MTKTNGNDANLIKSDKKKSFLFFVLSLLFSQSFLNTTLNSSL